MPSMIWTVIPRGVKNGSLTMGIYITASQGDTSFLSLPLDGTQGTDVWTQWYANRTKDLLAGTNPGGSIKLLINGTIVSDALTFAPLSATQQESSSAAATWQALLCYKQPDWDDQSTGGPKPKADCDPGAAAAAKVPSPRPYGEPVSAGEIYSASASGKTKAVSSHLYKLHEHVGNLSATAAVGAVMRRTPTAEGEATATMADAQVTLRMNDLAILQPVDSSIGGRAPTPGPNANAFKTWLGAELVSNPTTGQVAQRNLYRLSDDPYHRLQDWVFPIVQTLAQNPNAYTDSSNDATRRQARFVQHAIFHRRCQPPKLGSQSAPPVPAPVAILQARETPCTPVTVGDFYRTLTLLARFPEWLQRLGFSYTVTVPIPGGTTITTVALTGLPSLDSVWTNIAPTTQCTSSGYAAALPNGIFKYQDNLLLLDPATTKLVDNDVDGSALRVVQHSNSLQLSSKTASPALSPDMNPPDPAVVTSQSLDTALPTRSIGISLLHMEHNQHQEACIKNQYNLRQKPGAPVLGLVDLIRGYAPEVLIGGKWISLTCREVTYNDETKALPQPYALIHLEGAVHDDTPSSTSGIGSVPDLHVPQALFRWNGWSLTVPSPFPVAPATCTAKNNAPKFPIKATYRAASGSLVRLRFGAEYPVRVRLVDLLSEVMECGDNDPSAIQTITYLRHDPVPPPELLLEGDINGNVWPGETMTTLIVRDDDTSHLPRRCLCPPLATLELMLQHGVLDAPNVIFSKNGFLNLNEIGSFQVVFIDANSGDFPLRTVIYSDGTHQVSCFEPPIALPSRTYLPDPMARLVQPEILDLATQKVDSDFPAESLYGTERKWPDAHRLRVQMDSVFGDKPYAGWHTDPIDKVRTLMVSVPKGWQIKLRLKSVPGADKAKLFAAGDIHTQSLSYLQKLFPGVSLPDVDTIDRMLGAGALSQYTPPLELILIHAVRRPLKSSTLQAPVAPPAPGLRQPDCGVHDGGDDRGPALDGQDRTHRCLERSRRHRSHPRVQKRRF